MAKCLDNFGGTPTNEKFGWQGKDNPNEANKASAGVESEICKKFIFSKFSNLSYRNLFRKVGVGDCPAQPETRVRHSGSGNGQIAGGIIVVVHKVDQNDGWKFGIF